MHGCSFENGQLTTEKRLAEDLQRMHCFAWRRIVSTLAFSSDPHGWWRSAKGVREVPGRRRRFHLREADFLLGLAANDVRTNL